ncbi:tubulin-specific chaperone A isoform X1 [Nasonia vitripennis]|uniref:Uncharacterized protein n=1 Tax=Nasonia vitripennis TaxID=7425 RepID=A0A7M7Q3E1_NASVI|nr:tubulin-specific chaperone A isoform X1 [Nasonia vitripennis]
MVLIATYKFIRNIALNSESTATYNVPTCHYFPTFKQSLEGIAWRQAIGYLLRLKLEKNNYYKKYLDELSVFAKVCNVKFSAQVKYQSKCEWCIICNSKFCNTDDCPRRVTIVDYEYFCTYSNNAKVTDLLRWIICCDVLSIQFTIDNKYDIGVCTDNHRCPIHVNSDKYFCNHRKGDPKLSLDYYF